jgi:hypothetical protein
MSKFLQIALNENNNVVSIFQVATGKKCNCKCPECGEILEAKNKGKTEDTVLKTNQKQAHFAHSSGKVCQYAAESALHKMAKEILLKHKSLMLPALYHINERVRDEFHLTFDSVELEQRIEQNGVVITPDAILTKGNKKLFVEFYKSHLVDENKKSKIEKIGISTIEIDLNYIEPVVNGKPNYEGLREYLAIETDSREWIFNTESERLYKEKRAKDPMVPKYSPVFLKKQEKELEEAVRLNESERNQKKQYRQYTARDNWKDKAIAKGYVLVKIYGKYDYFLYCPKEKKNENKIDADNCKSCEYFLNNYFPDDDRFSLCGFKSNIKKI